MYVRHVYLGLLVPARLTVVMITGIIGTFRMEAGVVLLWTSVLNLCGLPIAAIAAAGRR